MSLLEKRMRWQKINRSERNVQMRIAVLSTFTANPLEPYLGTALEDLGLPARIWFGPYNQIVQECLSPDSQTCQFSPDVLIVWPRLEDLWGGRSLPLTDDPASYAEELLQTAEASLEGARMMGATLIFALPGIPELRPLGIGDASHAGGVFAAASKAREALRERLAGQKGVLLVDVEDGIRTLGSRFSYNHRLFTLARIPYSEELFDVVGQLMARAIRLSRQSAKKVVVVDADNTLWGGVVGEDGPDGVDLKDNGPGEAYRQFQSFLLELRRAGWLLALCSKNEEADVWEVFHKRREMRLKKEHFAAWRIGWQAKSASLREMADELQLGVNSFVFIDDSPVEIAEVQANLPEVECIQMPADPARWIEVIPASIALDRLPPTAEDLKRASFYQQERLRKEEERRAATPEEYLSRLEIHAHVFAPASSDLGRLAQMVAKTNQFNLNCRRRSESELLQIVNDERYLVRLVQVKDRFGDYGIVGAFIVRKEEGRAEIDTFLLSCRAMGRGIEEAMIATMWEELSQSGIHDVVATVEEHPRNEPARRFFARLGCDEIGVPSSLKRVDWPAWITRMQGAVLS